MAFNERTKAYVLTPKNPRAPGDHGYKSSEQEHGKLGEQSPMDIAHIGYEVLDRMNPEGPGLSFNPLTGDVMAVPKRPAHIDPAPASTRDGPEIGWDRTKFGWADS